MDATEDQAAALEKLRAPFPPEVVGKLPRVTCSACSKNRERKVCDKHVKAKCAVCNNFISTAHMHIDYVGHAEVTDRLLTIDPLWSWEPLALDAAGLPAFVVDRDGNPVGLWIKLTIAGVTRLGYGSVEGGKTDALKELIGDALRNAAMRFGVALTLWSKAELESQLDESVDPNPPVPRTQPPAKAIDRAQRERFLEMLDRVPDGRAPHPTTGEMLDNARATLSTFLLAKAGVSTWADFPADRAEKALEWLDAESAKYAPLAASGEETETPPPPSSPSSDSGIVDKLRSGLELLLEQMTDEQAVVMGDWIVAQGFPAKPSEMTEEQAGEAWTHASEIIEGASA